MKIYKLILSTILLLGLLGTVNADEMDFTDIYYKYDIDSVSQVDSSSNNDATVTSATYTASGILGGAYDYDGASDYIESDSVYDSSTELTVNFWFQYDSDTSTPTVISGCSSFTTTTDCTFYVDINGDKLRTRVSNGVSASGFATSTTTMTTGTWYMGTLIYDGSIMQLYLNGVNEANVSFGGPLNSNDQTITTGARVPGNANNNLEGRVDEVGVWSRTLTVSEVVNLYNSGSGCSYLSSCYPPSVEELLVSNSAHYKFENDVLDASDNGNDGTNYGTTDIAGIIDRGRDFDGSNDWVDIPETSNLGVNDDFTLNQWVSFDATGSNPMLWSSGDGTPYARLYNNAGTSLVLDYWDGSVNSFVIYSITLNTSQWYMITSIMDRTNDRGLLYLDGEEVGNFSIATLGALTTGRDFKLGQRNSVGYFNGQMDEVGTWNKALTSDEISNLYNGGDGLQYPFEIAPSQVLTTDLQDYYTSNDISININSTIITDFNYSFNGGANTQFDANTNQTQLNLTGVEGLNNLTIWTNTTEDNLTFTIDTVLPNISLTAPSEINTFNFNFDNVTSCSDSNLDTCLITTDEGETFSYTNNSYDFATSGNHTYNVTATDLAGNTYSLNDNLILVNPYAFIYVEDEASNIVTNYSLLGINENNGYMSIPYYNSGLTIGETLVEFNVLGYAITDLSVNLTTASPNYNNTFIVSTAKIVLNIYDLETGALMTENVDVELIATNYTGTAVSGQLNISQVSFYDGDYTLNLVSTNYESEAVFFSYTNQEIFNLNAYMLPSNTTNLGVLNVKAETSLDTLKNQLINLLKWDSSSSSYITVGQSKTDSNGDAFFNVELGTTFYKVTGTRSTETITSPEQKIIASGTVIFLIFSDSIEEYVDYTASDILYNLTNTSHNSTHELITFGWNDPNNLAAEACLIINRLNGAKATELSENCVSSANGEIQVYTEFNNTYTKEMLAVVRDIDTQTKLDNIVYPSNLNLETSLGNLAKWIVLMLMVIVIGLGIVLGNVNIIGIGTIVMSWVVYSIFPQTLGYTIPLLITVVSILILYGTFKKRF